MEYGPTSNLFTRPSDQRRRITSPVVSADYLVSASREQFHDELSDLEARQEEARADPGSLARVVDMLQSGSGASPTRSSWPTTAIDKL